MSTAPLDQERLEQARLLLREGVRLSGQSKSERGKPRSQSIPILSEARGLLRRLAETESQNAEVWRLLSEAEECLLGYRAAVEALERAIALCPTPEKPDLTRLARLRESSGKWLPLELTFTQLRKLRDFLAEAGVVDVTSGAMLRHTRRWLEANGVEKPSRTLKAFASRGATTDFEVLLYTSSV